LAFSHKGKYFAAGIGTTIRLWKNNNWRKSETLSAHNKPVVSIAFSPNDRSIATASLDSTICVWSIDGSVDFTQFKAHNERVQKICFSPNGEYLLSGGSDSKVKLWSGAGWKTVVPYNSDAPVCDLVFDKLGDKFYMATADGYVHYYSKSDENLAHNFVNLPITEGFVNNGTSAKRVAILIANAAYDADSKLQNPLRDADSLEVALKALNFEVFKYQNLEYQGMLKAISDFGDYIGEKKRQGWNVASLIYFSGHGMQVRGHSYLVPINDHIGGEEDVEYEAYDLDRMFKKLEVEKGDINIVVIDACRNNPFDERLGLAVRKITLPSLQTGMGQPTQQSQNTIVAYSTMPNMLALDGFEDNSPFVKELLKYMRVPSLQIEDMFKEVRKAVRFKTQAQQIPWISSTLLGNFSFVE
jgi:WD40 repeat protein